MALNVGRLWCKCFYLYGKKRNLASAGVHITELSRSLSGYGRDPAPLFFSLEVQQLMKKLTKVDTRKVFRNRKMGEKLEEPQYKFMTSEELEKCVQDANRKVEEKLQVPPIVKERDEINEVLGIDRAIIGVTRAKFVFTDISHGVSNKDRMIVVREPDGVLRKAYWEERFRMNEIYFPSVGRHLKAPRMFEEQYLMNVLDRGDYEFLLDSACIHYEPNDPEYHRVTSTTYDHIEREQKFDSLQSTRHFGALTFYLSWNKRIDKFLLHYIQNDQLEDAVLLIKLFHLLNQEAKSAKTECQDTVEFVRAFIENDSDRKSVLELALQTLLELQRQQQILEEGIKKAHGL